MEIRRKLAYQFTLIVALILLLSSLTIYFSFSGNRKEDFFDRLGSKATMVAQMLIEFDEIDAELLKRIEAKNPLSLPNEKIVIYDYENQVLYTNDEAHEIHIDEESINEVRLNGNIKLKQGKYEILGQFYTSEYERFVVFAAAMDIFGFSKLKNLGIILLVVYSICLGLTFISGRIYATRALRPISDIMTQAEAIGVSNLDARISEGTGNDEITRLAKTFNRVLDRLELAFKTQKSFIANASHELRTPLTVITGQLEVILMNTRSKEEYLNTILSLLEDIKRLNHLANRLLMLDQVSSGFSDLEFAPLRIDDAVWQARKEVLKNCGEYRVPVHFSEEIDNEDKLIVRGNEHLLKTAIMNLMDNGCKYSGDHTVEVSIKPEDRDVVLRFSDRGIGIPEKEAEMIFQPFYRARNVIGFEGHGIGLSLVKRIIAVHGGQITVSSEEDKGTTVAIQLRTL